MISKNQIRGAVGLGILWAVIWAVTAVAAGSVSEWIFGYSLESHADPLVAMAMPGFIGGILFFLLIQRAGRGRRFSELPLCTICLWGAATGLVLGITPFLLGTPTTRFPRWLVTLVVVGAPVAMSSVSAVTSALLYRAARNRKDASPTAH